MDCLPLPVLCIQCGTDQNPCHCKIVGPTLGMVSSPRRDNRGSEVYHDRLLTELLYVIRLRRSCCIGCECLPEKLDPRTLFVGYIELKVWAVILLAGIIAVWVLFDRSRQKVRLDFFSSSSIYYNFGWMNGCMNLKTKLADRVCGFCFSRMLGLPVDINTAVSDCIPIWYRRPLRGQEIRGLLCLRFTCSR